MKCNSELFQIFKIYDNFLKYFFDIFQGFKEIWEVLCTNFFAN